MTAKTEVEQLNGDLGVSQTLGEYIECLQQEGIMVEQVPLGGTIAMVRGKDNKLVAVAEGCFGSPQLQTFNHQVVNYSRRYFLEPLTPDLATYRSHLEANGRAFPLTTSQILEGGLDYHISPLWPDMVMGWPLPTGKYAAEELVTDETAAAEYSAFLSIEIISGRYPKGIRLDSNELYDNSGVFAAIISSYLIPRIEAALNEFSLQREITFEQALKEAIFIVPVGTDREAEVSNFLDCLGFFSGLTFITVGANSEFGAPGGDAEANLYGAVKVTKAIAEGKLTRGIAYSVADGVVMRNLLGKMHPEAKGPRKVIRGADGYYYGGTFQAYFTYPLDRLGTSRLEARPTCSYHPSVFYRLVPFSVPIEFVTEELQLREEGLINESIWTYDVIERIWRENVAEKASNLTRIFNSVHRSSIMEVRDQLPIGTRVWIVEGGGEANGPAQAAAFVRKACDQQFARSKETMRPTIVVSTDAGFPFVGDTYAAGLVAALEARGEKVVNARTVPPKVVEQLARLWLNAKVGSNTAHLLFDEVKAALRIDPLELQKIIDTYGWVRGLQGFQEDQVKI